MRIPLSYNLRNLSARRATTLMTALGIALPVAVLLAALALVGGLEAAFRACGNPLNILVLRKGSSSELSSAMNQQTYRDLLYKPGIAYMRDGNHPLVSLELVTVITLPKLGDVKGQSVTLRGLLPVGLELRQVALKEGRWFQPGRRELVVGESVAQRCPEAHLGGAVRIGNSKWNIVGVMDAGSSAMNSETFADLEQVRTDFNRREQLNSVLLRAFDASTVSRLVESFNNDQRLNVTAQPERAFYEGQTASGAPIQQLGILIAVIMSIGSCLTATNTMYAAVARRSKEIGTLRVLGFSSRSILLSFLVESLLLAGVGGIVGCLAALPLNSVTTSVGNFTTMSETSFRFRAGPSAMVLGILFALVMGTVGGLFPARNAARKQILEALRES